MGVVTGQGAPGPRDFMGWRRSVLSTLGGGSTADVYFSLTE